MNIHLPEEVKFIIKTLDDNAFKGYIVGGCVRDSILKRKIEDWDIATNAVPQNLINIFKDFKIIKKGIKHGTISVIVGNKPFEITTFRVDGTYSDNRRPDNIKYVKFLEEDLSRRDFTINSMAYNEEAGLIDIFGGRNDLNNHLIKCVGDADLRFKEDALRMLRAIRFSARLGFDIDKATEKAIFKNSYLLKNISKERIQEEFNKIILAEYAVGVRMLISCRLMDYIIPEFVDCINFSVNQKYQAYDLSEHILKTVEYAESNLSLKLAMLLHDTGKPHSKSTTDKGEELFIGHEELSSKMAEKILQRLKYDKRTIFKVRELILYHGAEIPETRKSIREWLNKLGEKGFKDLLKVKNYDIRGYDIRYYNSNHGKLENINKLLEYVLNSKDCYKKEDLAVSGTDLINIGYSEGKEIGTIIDELLQVVIEEPGFNTKEKLMNYLISKNK